ncbi:MAG TPA: PKD domain-containing protein [Kofleriaceae bacterium]
MLTQHVDSARTGWNPAETQLTLQSVGQQSFGKLFTVPVIGRIFAHPLFVPQVSRADGTHDIVVVATEANWVYGIDGQSGAVLWQRNLGTPIDSTAAYPQQCMNIPGTIGITGTPVIDPATGTIYLVAANQQPGPVYQQFLHALDVATGVPRVTARQITAQVLGDGPAAVNGLISFDALRANQRAGLLLLGGQIYVAWGGHCDDAVDAINHPGSKQIFFGWIMSFDPTTLARTGAFNTAPRADPNPNEQIPYGGSIWQSGGGLASDGNRIYLNTGNALFNPSIGSWGDSTLAFTPSLGLASTFTPFDQAFLDNSDLDLSAGGVVIVPGGVAAHANLLVTTGKEGTIYVLDRNALGGAQPAAGDVVCPAGSAPGNCVVGELSRAVGGPGTVPNPGGYFGIPAYFNGQVYFAGNADQMKSFTVGGASAIAGPTHTTTTIFNYPGSTPSVSSNGTADGIVWALERTQPGPFQFPDPTYLHAYTADTLAELYNSHLNDDDPDGAGQFMAPTIAGGRVYVGTSSSLAVYGLTIRVTPGSQSVVPGSSTTYTVVTAAIQGLADTVTFSVSGLPAGTSASFSPASVPRGGTATLTLTTTTATPVGTFSFTVAATGPSRTVSATAGLTVAQRPVAAFTSSCSGRTCSFDGSASQAFQGRTIVSYAWSFSDGGTASGATPDPHHYPGDGSFQATLTVTDSGGLSSQPLTQTVTVSDQPPHAGFSVVCIDRTCFPDAETSNDDVGITSYSWNWGDGSAPSTGSNLSETSHVYAAYGAYTITLTVSDVENHTATDSHPVALGRPPTASFTIACTGRICDVDASASTGDVPIASYHWDWDDETATDSGAPTAHHVYASDDTFAVHLRVTDINGNFGDLTKSVTVADAPPHAGFSFVCIDRACFFDPETTSDDIGVTSFTWDWGDGTTTSGIGAVAAIEHDFAYGTYAVKLTVVDIDSQTDAVTQTVTVVPAPVAAFTASCSGLLCSFDASASTSAAAITSYHWDWDDETALDANVATAQHRYAFGDTFRVHLRVTDATGHTADVTHSVTATAPPPGVVASFTFTCSGRTCQFDASGSTSSAAIVNYHWDWDDETTTDATSAAAQHVYAWSQTFLVHLAVTDSSGQIGRITRSVVVH